MGSQSNIIYVYHGTDHVLEKPIFGAGRDDNDYGNGFYTTEIKERAEEWALLYGSEKAVVNRYRLDLTGLNIIRLDEYGPLAWIAEVISNRGMNSPVGAAFAERLLNKYKVDTSAADIIIGYRADDSYGDVIEAFMSGEINVDEVVKLFYKGELGDQIFVKSSKAFDSIEYTESYVIAEDKERTVGTVYDARREVLKFLENRRIEIAGRFTVPAITVADVVNNDYVHSREYGELLGKDSEDLQGLIIEFF